jgi:hypothetical protein
LLTFTVNRDRFPAVTPRYAATAEKVLYLYESRHCSSGGNDKRKERKTGAKRFSCCRHPGKSLGFTAIFSFSLNSSARKDTQPEFPGPLTHFSPSAGSQATRSGTPDRISSNPGPGQDCQRTRVAATRWLLSVKLDGAICAKPNLARTCGLCRDRGATFELANSRSCEMTWVSSGGKMPRPEKCRLWLPSATLA